MEEDNDKEYRWETGYEKTWEAITEDSDGLMEVSVQELIQKAKRKRMLERCGGKTRLGMMRHLFVVLDMSGCMNLPDLKPSRFLCVAKLLESFLEEFFYLNPISQVGLITTMNKRAELVSELAGNPRQHVDRVRKLANHASEGNCSGEPSLQNALEMAAQTLRRMPGHVSRELLVIVGSLTTCDPGNIQTTIATCKTLSIRCSVIALAAEVRICRELADATGGTFNVVLDDVHLRDLLKNHLEPPPSALGAEPTLIKMGFPCHSSADESCLSLCMCHLDTGGGSGCKLSTAGFLCPQCQAKYCELPVECKCCGLTLVSAPHLARSYHHLFPLPPFGEVQAKDADATNCTACVKKFDDLVLYRCPNCRKMFCCDCDIFFHETLHSCPGCVGTRLNGAGTTKTNGSPH